ncbi:flagellar assembly protein FliW [Fontisphaera persica]|jgi:flagellar assembly factor FliW|uniref:flagellar assembly protein FliW n=1 Tax=Fontisphaera persica TaxID=2974023 RepID=UPI0024C0E018|nr:flagellar assembly protein FliW [Fontisphaera persica]WCJ58183.1 flagellar assembly protein FliW [Fontisphaera persica]
MKVAETVEARPWAADANQVLHFPAGLLGFENLKQYVLLGSPEEAPFLWLQVVDEPNLAFVVVPPAAVVENYTPDLSDEDVEFLGLQSPEDALVLNIVTVRGPTRATVNLKGPLVINRRTLVGKQVIPHNAAEYPVNHPLAVGE